MLAAIPLLISLAAANVAPAAKRDEGLLVQRDATPFEISKRDGFSIGADIVGKISSAIESTIHVPGINNTLILDDIVDSIDKDLSILKTDFEELRPPQIGDIIENSVATLEKEFSGIAKFGAKLVASIKASIGDFLGVDIN